MQNDKKWQERIDEVELSYRIEWQRLIEDNHELQQELRRLRRRYGLPLDRRNKAEVLAWWAAQRAAELPHHDDLRACIMKHNIPWEWSGDVQRYLVYNTSENLFRVMISAMPYITWSTGEEQRIVIPPDADVVNPVTQDQIKSLQRGSDEPLPEPVPDPNNPRKLDWRPVTEWCLRRGWGAITEYAARMKAAGMKTHRVTVQKKVKETLSK